VLSANDDDDDYYYYEYDLQLCVMDFMKVGAELYEVKKVKSKAIPVTDRGGIGL
jgi:hypothetical protein